MRYDTVPEEIRVAGSSVSLLRVRDSNRLLDTIDPETFAVDERLPYWADLWTSSIELARWCLEEGDVQGKAVLEVGCGIGLAGIVAARAGAAVTMTDYEPDALVFARYNALLNLPAAMYARLVLREMDWRSPLLDRRYDVIMGGDVVYERRNFLPLLELLQAGLMPEGCAVLTDPGRRTGMEFFALAAKHGFVVEQKRVQVSRNGRTNAIVRGMLRRNGREV